MKNCILCFNILIKVNIKYGRLETTQSQNAFQCSTKLSKGTMYSFRLL